MKIDEISNEVIDYLRNNQGEITTELLETLRSHGNEGKQLALDILDMPKDGEEFYLDAFDNRLSFNGNRRLKRSFAKLNLSQIHIDEIKRCAEDVHYFKDNYVKIKTKDGIAFPELREYQNGFIDTLTSDAEDIVTLQGRQCCGASVAVDIINNSKEYNLTFKELFDECKKESGIL